MSETSTGTPGDGAGSAAPGGTPPAVPAPAATSPAPGGDAAAGGSAPETGKARLERKQNSGAQGAAKRAAARKAGTTPAATGDEGTPDTSVAKPAAGGGDGAAPAPGAAGDDGNGGTAAAGADGANNAPAGSTVTAPDDWPSETRQRFEALPNDDARAMTLEFYRDMHRQFTEATQAVAQLRKNHEALAAVAEQHQVDPAEAARVLTLAASFNESPRQVLEQLARDAGIEVFFERPLPAGEIPEFATPAEMAEWVKKQTLTAVEAERQAAEKKAREAADRERYRAQISTELDAARKQYGEPFLAAQTAVMERMVTPLSVDDAWQLLQVETLRKQADEGAQAKRDLAAARAELEANRKRATQPPAGVNGHGAAPALDDARLSPAERATRRAAARKAAAANA